MNDENYRESKCKHCNKRIFSFGMKGWEHMNGGTACYRVENHVNASPKLHVPLQSKTQPCKHCGELVYRRSINYSWVHAKSDRVPCYAKQKDTEATPSDKIIVMKGTSKSGYVTDVVSSK